MSDEPIVHDAVDDQDPLEDACARNVPLELHSVSYDRAVPAARARMIDLDEDYIYLEKPQIIGRNVRLHKAQLFEAFFNYNDVLFTFKTHVAEPTTAVRLNRQKIVEGLVVERPPAIKPGQRRQYYRTSLASIPEPIHAMIQETGDVADDPQPDDRGAWQPAAIVDASAGGFGVRIDDGKYTRYKIYHNYFVRISLPDGRTEITVLCELRQVRSLLNGQATKLGMLLLPWPTQAKLNWHIQPLLSFLTQMQRNRLAS